MPGIILGIIIQCIIQHYTQYYTTWYNVVWEPENLETWNLNPDSRFLGFQVSRFGTWKPGI